MRYIAILIFSLATTVWSGCDVLKEVTDVAMGTGGVLSDSDIAAGLKQALEIGTGNASKKLNETNGYYGDPLVKIPFPAEAQRVVDKLEQLGMERQINEFVLKLNRGAEKAAKEAAPIFVNAIKAMTITDARGILAGPENAATQFFREKTSQSLYDKFSPVIRNTLEEVKAATLWETITSTYNKIPLVTKVNTDLTDYATNKALDGLFLKLAGEEKKIRTDPTARVTELLKRVFSS